MRRPAVILPLFLVLFSVPAQALTRISPTEVVAGGRMFTLRGFADDEPFDPDDKTLTWRRADQPASAAIRLSTRKVGRRQLRAQVPAELIAEPGDFLVGVAGVSGSFPFTVLPASPGGPSCRIQPRNTYLPTHLFEPHLFNPDGHPPHELSVAVTLGGTPLSGVNLSLLANKAVFLDSSENPSLTTMTVQTDTDGRAVFDYVPPSQEPFDRTDIEASGSVDGISFSCRGIVVTGLGALTASYQGLRDMQGSMALLRRVWEKLIARAAIDQDPAELSLEFSNHVERIARTNAAFLSRLRDTVKEHRPLLERIAAGRPVTASEDALNEMEALLGPLEAQASSELQRAVRRVQGYLANVRRLAKLTGRIDRTLLREQRRDSALQQTQHQERTDSAAPRIRAAYDKLQLSFEANMGQASSNVRYLARGPGYNLYLLPQEAVLVSGLAARGPIGPPSVVRIQLVGARPGSRMEGVDKLPGKSHYLFGKNPANWHTEVPHFAKVRYEEVYPGVDLVYYGNQSQLEYDFVVAPGASPDAVSLGFDGVQGLQLDDRGDLVLDVGREQFRLKKPFIYQQIDGVRQQFAGHYTLGEGGLVGFEVESYDRSRALVIDPVLSYSSYAGGGNYDTGLAIAVDSDGSAYITGATTSVNFPTLNSLQPGSASGTLVGIDVFVMKLNSSGSGLVYSTYVGGGQVDVGAGIAVDAQGNAYVTGSTQSEDFPVVGPGLTGVGESRAPSALISNPATKQAMRDLAGTETRSFWGWNQIYQVVSGKVGPDPVALLPPRRDGRAWKRNTIKNYRLTLDQWWALVTETPRGLRDFWQWNHYFSQLKGFPSLDPLQLLPPRSNGRAWSRKSIKKHPLTADQWWSLVTGPRQDDGFRSDFGARGAFVVKLNPAGSGLVYATRLGGGGDDRATSIAVDSEGNAYVTGTTSSLDFPVKNAIQVSHGGGEPFYPFDAFVTKLNAAGSEIVYSTYLGGDEYDGARGIAVDSDGNAYVSGSTDSPNFPTTMGAFNTNGPAVEEDYEAFVVKLDPSGTALLYSTYLGGESNEWGLNIAVDGDGNAYVTGITGSPDFPVLNAAQEQFGSDDLLGFDAFVTKLNAEGSELVYSTFLGGAGMDIGYGIAVDEDGNAYVAGETESNDFPSVGAFQPASGGLSDGFVVKLDSKGSVEYSTYLGGSDRDSVLSLALDAAGDSYVTGLSSSGNSPVTVGAFQTSSAGLADVMVAKIEPGTPLPVVTSVSAASFDGGFGLASESIASGFWEGLAGETAVAASLPLPRVLAGTSVRVTDSTGGFRLAPLFFVSAGQINYLMPEGTAAGLAKVSVERGVQEVASGTVQINSVAPALFSTDASGQGPAAASFLRIDSEGSRSQALTFDPNSRASVPIDLGPEGDQVFLLLFGTGVRGFSSQVTATVGGESVPVLGAVPQGEFVGLDQINIGPLPRSLAGRGEVNILLTADGKPANTVTVNVL